MSLLPRLFAWAMRPRLARFARDLADPAAAQRRRLADILGRNARTAFGREHGFGAVRGPDDFRRAVPLRPYEGFVPWLARARAGEPGVLTADPVRMFCLTSGTSAEPKLCPVTRAFTREMHLQHLLWMCRLVHDHPGAGRGSYLTIVSPAESFRTPGGIPVGAMSGRQLLDQAWPIRRRQAVPYEVAGLEPAAKYHAALVFALGREDLSVVTSVNPSTLVLLADLMRERAGELLDDLAAGRLAHAPGLGAEARAVLERRLRPRPERARRLAEAVRGDGALCPRHAWPDLAVLATWQGGSAPFYLSRLDGIWPDAPRRCLGLRASEGNFSIPLADATPAGALAVGGAFLEFLPEEAACGPDAPTLLAHELERGRRYRMILTTSGGFYRYDLADIVEVVGFRDRTPEIAFLHKAGNVLSVTGEKVTEDQAVAAMREAGRGVDLAGFSLTLELILPPRYVLAVEAGGGAPLDAAGLLDRFEAGLGRINPEYAEKRASGRLAPPRLLRLAPGTYRKWRAAQASAGRPDGQIKPPHLVRPAGPGPLAEGGGEFFRQAKTEAGKAVE